MLDDDDDEDGDRPTFPDDPSVQHSHLARLLLRLKNAAAAQGDSPNVSQLLDALLADVHQHFASEEYTMERTEYPHGDEHRERHHKFIQHLEAVKTECERRNMGLTPAVAEQLENWFNDHEATADAELLLHLGVRR